MRRRCGAVVVAGLLGALLHVGIASADDHGWNAIGAQGGDVAALAVAPSSLGTIYAAIAPSADPSLAVSIDRSLDGGRTWTPRATGVPQPKGLAVDGLDASRVFAASSNGLSVSGDAGATWSSVPAVPGPVHAVATDTTGRVAVATDAGAIDVSTDDGATFKQHTPRSGAVSLLLPTHAPDVIVEDSADGLWYSTNDGTTWHLSNVHVQTFPPVATPDGTLYAAAGADVYRSVDDGTTWQPLLLGQVHLLTSIAVDTTGAVTVATSDFWVGRSLDGGATWSWSIVAPGIVGLAATTGGRLVGATSQSGVWASDDGVSWSWSQSGAPGPPLALLGVATDPTLPGRIYVASSDAGILRSDDGGASWESINVPGLAVGSLRAALTVDASRPGRVFAKLVGDGIARSDDAGGNWAVQRTGGPLGMVALDPSNDGRAFDAGALLYRSLDGGTSWDAVGGLPTGDDVTAVAVSPRGTVVIGTSAGGVFESSDAGDSWRGGPVASLQTVESIVPDPRVPGTLYALTANGPHVSFDEGATWYDAMDGLPPASVTGMALDPSDPNTLFASTGTPPLGCGCGGVYWSTDGAATWGGMNLAGRDVAGLATDAANSRLYAASAQGLDVLDLSLLPRNVSQPSVSPTSAMPGTSLRCDSGSWTGPGIALDLQWWNGDQPIDGATGTTYTATAADVGGQLWCSVVASNDVAWNVAVSNLVAVSSPSPPPPPPPPPPPTPTPTPTPPAGPTPQTTAAAPCHVPRLAGHTLAYVRAALTHAHCKLGRITRHASTRVRAGRVLSTAPRAGARLRPLAHVAVVLSSGRPGRP
jgi:hypothetical protein